MKVKSLYIGDGVYASFDGYAVWLALDDHNNDVVALEPRVWANLARFVSTIPNMVEEEDDDTA